jgi:hypothetical protein
MTPTAEDDQEIRIVGRRSVLERPVIGGGTAPAGVLSFVRKWRAREDSNVRFLPRESRRINTGGYQELRSLSAMIAIRTMNPRIISRVAGGMVVPAKRVVMTVSRTAPPRIPK